MQAVSIEENLIKRTNLIKYNKFKYRKIDQQLRHDLLIRRESRSVLGHNG